MSTADVLPARVRRRWRNRDALLPALLGVELLAGVALGAVWDWQGDLLQDPAEVTVVQVQPAAVAVVVVPPAPAPTPPPAPVRTVPRNPFAVQVP